MQKLHSNVTSLYPSSGAGLLLTRRRAATVALAARRGGGGGEDLVDEGMVQLRERIREVERAEGRPATSTSTEGWMGWEKRYYECGAYDEEVVRAVGLLQRFLLGSRPSVAAMLAAAAVIGVSTVGVVVASQVVVALVTFALG